MPQRHLPLPPILFLSCLGASSAVHTRWPFAVGTYSFATGLLIGGLMLLAGATRGGAALLLMTKADTPIEPGHEPVVLVTSGPFRITRNPLYVTLVLVHAAVAVMVNSWWIAFGAALLVFLIDRLVVRKEEVMISARFGAVFDAYRARVRRWV